MPVVLRHHAGRRDRDDDPCSRLAGMDMPTPSAICTGATAGDSATPVQPAGIDVMIAPGGITS
jgi:hypothetical protein